MSWCSYRDVNATIVEKGYSLHFLWIQLVENFFKFIFEAISAHRPNDKFCHSRRLGEMM